MKKCNKCNIEKTEDQYFNNNSTKDKLSNLCKECDKTKSKEFRINKYGLTIIEHLDLLKNQDYKCAICGDKDDWKSLNIDHCHSSGKVRGLLCTKCNTGLGMFNDKTELLLLAATYLEQSKI